MAKKKADSDTVEAQSEILEPGAPAEDDAYASFFAAELKHAERVVGADNLFAGSSLSRAKYGIELPSLALQWILCHNVMHMGQFVGIHGAKASNKSAFAYEIARWVLERDGFARLYDTENMKVSETMIEGMLGHVITPRSWVIATCNTVDGWITMVENFLDTYREAFGIGRPVKAKAPKLKPLPFVIIVDSLTGSTTEASLESAKDGKSSNTQGMGTAKEINNWIQRQKLTGLPVIFTFVRHSKKAVEMGGMPGRPAGDRTPGGAAPDYYANNDLKFTVVKKNQLARMGYNDVKITCAKNSSGEEKRAFIVRFSWQYSEDNNGAVVVPRWEWDLATADFLAEFEGRKDELKDICHVVKGGTQSEPRFSCKQLGLRDVTGDDLGAAIRQDEPLYTTLQDFLHIKRSRIFDPNAPLE